jgi:predicted phosphodiesterase
MAKAPLTTRFLIISDTHNLELDNSNDSCHFRQPVPRADVILHCGDLTQVGGLSMYKKALKMLGSLDAELKLVIAGNHDISLDDKYWQTHLYKGVDGDNSEEDDDPAEHSHAMNIMKGPLAAESGVTYLEEGTHYFTLGNEARFSVYASPYTPEFCDWAFPYKRNEDRFSCPDQVAEGCTSIAENSIPRFPDIDIVMTHGLPKGTMDECAQDHKGCKNLLRAVRRARPRLHCFGHIHEGYGAEVVAWGPDMVTNKNNTSTNTTDHQSGGSPLVNHYPKPTDCAIAYGQQSLMVNAAIMTGKNEPHNAPWVIDIELPRAKPTLANTPAVPTSVDKLGGKLS